MKIITQSKEQRRNILFVVLLTWLPVVVFLGLIIAISLKLERPITFFFQDFFVITNSPIYTGFVSNIGIIFWSVTAGILFFISVVCYQFRASRQVQWFYTLAGVITVIMLFDDFFLFHEIIYPRFFNIHSGTVYIIYGVLGIIYLIVFRKNILASNFLVLFFAFLFFFISIVFDELRERWLFDPYWIVCEDGFKLLGIVNWLTYYFITSFQSIKELVQTK
ncbi:MAG: hypothetical protein QME58_05030 [Bacteroidota bacterium]|nr:hypothetical protein [Bacteroidota bacterium]